MHSHRPHAFTLVAWGLCECMLVHSSAVWLPPFTVLYNYYLHLRLHVTTHACSCGRCLPGSGVMFDPFGFSFGCTSDGTSDSTSTTHPGPLQKGSVYHSGMCRCSYDLPTACRSCARVDFGSHPYIVAAKNQRQQNLKVCRL